MCIGLPMTIIVLAYLLLWLRSLINPIYSFAGTLDSWERFFHFILRKGYANVDNAGGTIDDKIDYLEWLFSDLLPEQFGIIGLGVTVCSMIWLIKGRERRLLLSLLLMFMGTSVLLIGLIGFEYNESSRAVFRVYPLTAWLSLALGCLALATFKKSKKWQVVLASLLFFSTIWNTFSKNLHTDFADRYAKATLRTFKPNATVLTTSDYELPLIYKVEYEGIRPDISLYNDKSLVFQNRLTHGIAPKKEKEEAYRSLIKESQAPVYFFGNKNLNPYGGIDNGFVKEVDRNRVQGWYESAVDTFYAELIGDAFTLDDPWERMVQKQSLDILARQLFVTDLTKDEFLFFHQKLERTDYGKVALAIAWLKEGRFQKENIFTQKYYLAMLQALYENPPSNAYDASWVQFAYLQINALDTNQTLYQLENLYLGSIQAYSRIDNPCLLGYIKLLWVTKQYDKLLSFVKNYRVRLSSSPVLEWLREKERNANTLQGELQTEVKQLQQRVVPLIQSLSLDSAEKMLEKLDELQPGNFHTHYLQGLVAEHQKRLNEALAFYLGSLRINDSYPPPLYGAVMLLKKVGHAKDAEMLLDLYEHVVRNDMLLQQLK
ncbi:hypothetical protein CHS0354_000491 [Potamilus streckersoni]|uniref:Uncharacterized protein n=1 Tax=Potamilus streckersoni TaxID=2493646 RepID=A0AAE0W8B9_9BIVA|nr:hypothetical protein CHS0354_000491 [Potamilus streckersoni]